MRDDLYPGGMGFLQGSVRTYGKAVRLIEDVWLRVVGTEMPKLSGSPSQRYEEALSLLEGEMKTSKQLQKAREQLHDASSEDPELQIFLDENFVSSEKAPPVDIDDVSPNAFKNAAYRYAESCLESDETADVLLDVFLRGVVVELMTELGWAKRINIGSNRHFPRMLHWMRELEQDTSWDEGQGFRLMNASGRGAVAKSPRSPKDLKVRINPAFM